MIDKKLLEFCETEIQRKTIEAVIKHGSSKKAATAMGKARQTVDQAVSAVKKRAAGKGYAPDHDLTKPAAPGFGTKRISTLYGEDGEVKIQWHIQEKERQHIGEMLKEFSQGMAEELRGIYKKIKAPTKVLADLMSVYILGDQHFGMYAWAEETNEEDWDTEKSDAMLDSAIDRLVAMSPDSETGFLLNVGDFFHSNNQQAETAKGTKLDVDGRMGRTIRMSGHLFKRIIARLLQKHKKVIVLNARGNHDSDSALFLNEMLRMYYENEPRVEVMDNFAKLNYKVFGVNLILSHHGDATTPQRVYESATRNLRKEWGAAEYVFYWYGHIHHKIAQEIGGMISESWNVLPPPDAWHSGANYGSSRSMSCVVLDRHYGEVGRLKVGIKQINSDLQAP